MCVLYKGIIMETIKTDVLVIGGGINGSGVAVDAAGRGLDVVLCEANDLASATSSASSKLVHGGLRYLEQYEFKLVKEALREREVLLNKAPHIIQPLKFVLPHDKHLRPIWMIRVGIFLYDFLAGKMQLDKSKKIKLKGSIEGKPLKENFTTAFTYSDCRIDDARMVILNAVQAKEFGAKIFTNTKCQSAHRVGERWQAILKDKNGKEIQVDSSVIINAAGPWVADLLHNALETESKSRVRLIKGSHIVVPKIYEGNHAYILQNKDNRIVFALPYGFTDKNNNEYTCIGTTDINYSGNPSDVKISDEEVKYLCELINEYFITKVKPEDVIWDWSGVRPLYDDDSDDPSKNTREYHFEKEDKDGKGLLLSIFGGKITTFRTLSEKVLVEVGQYFRNLKGSWTAEVKTPGGECKTQDEIILHLSESYPWLDNTFIYRLATTYGLRSKELLNGCHSIADLGICFGYNLYQQEVEYMINNEWASDVDGILFRRTKLGLWLKDSEKDTLSLWLDEYFKKCN
jgi:glycerol-3-phosphate dehydrogenase